MKHPVAFAQAIPALHHHRPGKDGAVGVQDRARRARSAGGIDDIGGPVGVTHRIGGGGQRLHRADVPGRDRGDGVGARDAVCRDGDPGGKVAGDAIDLGAGQLA